MERIQAANGLGTEASRTAESLEALYSQEYRRIRLLAWKFGLPEDELDDAAREVFARVCAGFHRFRGDCALSTWLARIAVNHFTLRRRALYRRLRCFLLADLSRLLFAPGFSRGVRGLPSREPARLSVASRSASAGFRAGLSAQACARSDAEAPFPVGVCLVHPS